jgi:N-acetylglucosamine-6-sulfatase
VKLNRRTFLGVSAGGVASLGLRIPLARAALLAKPNILVIALDDMSSEESGALTYLNSEPFGRWTTFPNFVLNNPLCGPSRATTLTGQASHHHGVAYNTETNDLNDANVLPLWLQQAGYRTGLVGKYTNGYPFTSLRPQPYVPPGWNGWSAYVHGQQYENYTLRNGKGVDTFYPSSTANYSTDNFTQRAVGFLNNPSTAPFFLTLCYNAPHKPCTPATRHLGDFSDLAPLRPPNYNNVSGKPAWMQSLPPVDSNAQDAERKNAWRTLRAADEGIQTILNHLNNTGRLASTIVFVTSDNGYCHGQFRWVGKLLPYEPSCRTTMKVRHPSVASPPGRTVPLVVGNVDFASTVCQFAGANPGLPQDGASFAGAIDPTFAQPVDKAHLVVQRVASTSPPCPRFWGLRGPRFKYVEWDSGEVELYDLNVDPDELNNVADVPSYAQNRTRQHNILSALKA